MLTAFFKKTHFQTKNWFIATGIIVSSLATALNLFEAIRYQTAELSYFIPVSTKENLRKISLS